MVILADIRKRFLEQCNSLVKVILLNLTKILSYFNYRWVPPIKPPTCQCGSLIWAWDVLLKFISFFFSASKISLTENLWYLEIFMIFFIVFLKSRVISQLSFKWILLTLISRLFLLRNSKTNNVQINNGRYWPETR